MHDIMLRTIQCILKMVNMINEDGNRLCSGDDTSPSASSVRSY